MTDSSIEDRLTEEITLLSTKLVTAINKQSELEEKLFQYHKENHQLKTKLANVIDYEAKYTDLQAQYTDLEVQYNDLSASHASVVKSKQDIEAENKSLSAEVEELSASLFDEANKMVSDASRETYNFKVKNRKLYEELDEKDHIIDHLQTELVDLKKLMETAVVPVVIDEEPTYLNSSVFSPKIKAIRFDTSNYAEFQEFVKVLTSSTFQFDLANLKLCSFFKKVWTEEIERAIAVPSTNFLNRWQRGKYFWNLVADGKITIEPVKVTNETLKLDYGGDTKTPGVPTALREPCAFCQEQRNDNLEHSRLHLVKLLTPDTIESVHYPICNYCLIKLRNICEFFAKLRLIHKNFYKLDDGEEYQMLKLYLILIVVRSKIFWSKIGFWDQANDINDVKIDDLGLQEFETLFAHVTLDEHQPGLKQQPIDVISVLSQTLVSLVHSPVNVDVPATFKQAPSEEEFQDTVEELTVTRQNSKSKQFTSKLNSDLEDTLQMLQETLEE